MHGFDFLHTDSVYIGGRLHAQPSRQVAPVLAQLGFQAVQCLGPMHARTDNICRPYLF